MQKKKDKKIPKGKNSQTVRKSEGIFNYDLETKENTSKRKTLKHKKVEAEKSYMQEDFFELGNLNEKLKKNEKTNKKQIEKIKKKKRKEKLARKKEIEKQEREEIILQERNIKKKINPKKLERLRKRRKIIKYVSIIIVILIAIVLFLLSPVFNIKDIEVLGNEKISKAEIISLLELDENTNIFKETNGTIREKLKENKYIDSVNIRRVLPSTLILTIKERTIEYMLEFGSSYAYIDNQGNILEISKEKIEGKIKIQGYTTSIESVYVGGKLCEEDLEKMKAVRKIILAAKNAEIDGLVTSINIANKNDYTMYLESEKKTVHLGDSANLDMKMIYVKKIIEVEQGKDGEIFVNRDLNNKKSYFKENV